MKIITTLCGSDKYQLNKNVEVRYDIGIICFIVFKFFKNDLT